MEIYTMEIGKMTKDMEKVSTTGPPEQDMKEIMKIV